MREAEKKLHRANMELIHTRNERDGAANAEARRAEYAADDAVEALNKERKEGEEMENKKR